MAELIQKKLQGEVEKYQQLQKGKRAELLWSRPWPLSSMMMRRAPMGAGGLCLVTPCLGIVAFFLTPSLSRIVRFLAHLTFLIVPFLSPPQT